MTGPDPNFITSQNWAGLSDLLAALWLIAGAAIGFGASMLLAQGMIPSLAISRDVPHAAARRIRPALYAAAAAFLIVLLFGIALFIDRLGVISAIFYGGAQ